MPFCPVCGYEYEEGHEYCPDCEVDLVDSLSDEHFEGEMTEVYNSFSVAEAGMLKEMLYNEGIFAATTNEMGSSLMGSTPSEMGEVKIFVSDKDARRARELIEDYIEGNPLETEDEFTICSNCGASIEPAQESCPYCGQPLE